MKTRIVIALVSAAALLLLAAILSVTAAGPGSGGELAPLTSVTLNPIADTYVNQALPGTNYGSSAVLSVGRDEFLQEAYALVEFNLSSIPAGSTIQSATFSAYLRNADFDNIDIWIRRITEDWAFGTVTWNNKPTTTGGYPSINIGTTTGFYYSWDVTVLVNRWVNQSASYPNYGLALSGPTDKSFVRDFDSNNGANRPRLVVNYTAPTPTATVTRTRTRTATTTRTSTLTRTATRTATPTITLTATISPTPTLTPTGTQPTPTTSNTPTQTLTPTKTSSSTSTGTCTQTLTPTRTFTCTRTLTQTLTPTRTSAPGSIGDLVWNDTDRDGMKDAGESGIEGVRLDLVRDGAVVDTDFTDAGGHYLFAGLEARAYTVCIDPSTLPPGFELVAGEEPRLVILGGGENNLAVDFAYAHAPTRTPPPELTIDLYFDSFEVVQVVQDAPLVEDKSTVVRVYVGVRGVDSPVENVTARLVRVGVDNWADGLRSENAITVDPDEDPEIDNREDIAGTLNFRLPSSWRTGHYWINVWINYNLNVTECRPCTDNNVGATRLNYSAADPMNVVMVRVHADGLTPPGSARAETVRWMKKVYPINDINVYISGEDPIDADYNYTIVDGWDDLLSDLWWLNFWTDDPVDDLKYYGMLDDGVTLAGISGMGYRPGDEAAGVVTPGDVTGQQTFAHEVGHNLARMHAPCVTNPPANVDPDYPDADGHLDKYGLDAATLTLYTTSANYDLMSYCRPYWISSYTYSPLYYHFYASSSAQTSVQKPTRASGAAPAPAAAGNYLVVSGRLAAGQVTKLEPFYRIALPPGSSDDPGSGAYAIELQDGAGAALFTRAFDPTANPDLSDQGVFHEVLPYPDGVARIVIKNGAVELASRVVSAHAPAVTLLSPDGGEVWTANSTHTVSWSGSDGDGDALLYSLQYSPDNGLTWHALAANLAAQSHQVDAAVLSGSTQALIRVIASDGVNTALDTSDAVFSVERKAPEVYILTPEEGDRVLPGRLLELDGLATDVEDGPLGDTALVWSSDRQGILGIGGSLTTSTLLPGWHTLTLTALDSNKQTASASVRVFVGHVTYLPVINR